jgi:hypothetical protein
MFAVSRSVNETLLAVCRRLADVIHRLAPRTTGGPDAGRTQADLAGVIRITVYLNSVGRYYKMVQHGDASP